MSRLLVLPLLLALIGGAFALGSVGAQEEGVALSPQNESGVSGSVSLTPSGRQTMIVVTTSGTDAGSVHPAHVHVGPDCGNYAGIEVNLTDIMVDIDGMGTSSTTADVPITDIEDGNHVIVVHRGPTLADDPTPIACTPLPVAIAEPAPVAEEPMVEPAPAAEMPAEEAIAILPPTGSGGFLDDGSGGRQPTLPFVLLALGGAFLAAGAIGWRLNRAGR